ncbi:uncharacterized protein METZ01_LOCUS325794 [marine metagenome]|uniref:Uncharacterized protein n=1 Tax=marine metagenome TaxID=408172 RepID=A0A382PJI7_9ZZZZ
MVSERLAPVNIVPVRSLPDKSTPVRLVSERLAPVNIVPIFSVPDMVDNPKSLPDRSTPARFA